MSISKSMITRRRFDACAKFIEKAVKAIAVGGSYRVIPWPMGFVGKALRGSPNGVCDKLFSNAPRKKRDL
jgi:hypothetical protein